MNAITRSESAALSALAGKLSVRCGMDDSSDVLDILKATVFRSGDKVPTDSQLTALLIVANQYGLNPWTKEIYAYPDKNNGIVPVVGVDGWTRIINEHPQFDGVDFVYSEETVQHKGKACHIWIEAHIFRKDRSRPTVVREYLDEVLRVVNFATPWDSHPKRMHRHKTLIQCARIAFGFAGIYDEDEAHRIIDAGMAETVTAERIPTTVQAQQQASLPHWPAESFEAQFARWEKAIQMGLKTTDDILGLARTKGSLSADQEARIRNVAKADATDVQPITEGQAE